MLSKVCSAAVNGIDAYPVEVEVNTGWGDTLIVVVGLPDAAVKESKDRVSTALGNSGYKFPMGKTTVNLAPADRSEEHTSELQSLRHLVCRLLLEKKKEKFKLRLFLGHRADAERPAHLTMAP